MQNLTPQERASVQAKLEEVLKQERSKPFVVSIMGQTGVGKSSLINALFNRKLKTDPVRPCTKEIEPITIEGMNGQILIFNDLPGIGESTQADASYLAVYRKYLLDSDVVLWTIHADNRSTAFDIQALEHLLEGLSPQEQGMLMSRITFVLTKADVLSPPPWTMGLMGNYAIIKPGKDVREILAQKANYYQETFIRPYGSCIVSWTYNDVNFLLKDQNFSYTEHSVTYQGLLTSEDVVNLKRRYPPYAAVFDRLYDNYRVIPCSSLFRYNLHELLLVIVNKLGPGAIERIQPFLNIDVLNQVSLNRARQLCNLVIIDGQHQRKVFDLSEGVFPKQGSFF